MTTILLVDDDPLEAFVRKSALEKKFHDVQRVADPLEALYMMEEPQFAGKLRLVIADLHRPGLDGQQFVAETHARLPGMPVLVLTGPKGTPDRVNDRAEEGVRFLPQRSAFEEMLDAASQMMGYAPASPRVQ
jgi:CheY-like chemotaxis protein